MLSLFIIEEKHYLNIKKNELLFKMNIENLKIKVLSDQPSKIKKITESLNNNSSSTVRAIRILKQATKNLESYYKELPELASTNEMIYEVLNILKNTNNEEDYFDFGDSKLEKDDNDQVEFYKTFSQNYGHEMKAKNLQQLNIDKSKYTQKAKLKRKITLETVNEDEEKPMCIGFRKLSNAVKMKEKLNKVMHMQYNVFDFEYLQNKILPVTTGHIFKFLTFFEIGILDEETYFKFAENIAEGYPRNVPYHNDIHATDVFQTFFSIIHHSDLVEVIFIF